MFILIETIIENRGSYDGYDFSFGTKVSYQDVRFFSSKEDAIATAKAEMKGQQDEAGNNCLFIESFLHDGLIYEFHSKDFSGPERIVTYKVAEIQEK